MLLAHDVGMVTDTAGAAVASGEMHHVHHRPWEVKVHYVGFCSHFLELAKRLQGEAGGRDGDVFFDAAHTMIRRPERPPDTDGG